MSGRKAPTERVGDLLGQLRRWRRAAPSRRRVRVMGRPLDGGTIWTVTAVQMGETRTEAEVVHEDVDLSRALEHVLADTRRLATAAA